jgi:protein-tyrosine-phosphatase
MAEVCVEIASQKPKVISDSMINQAFRVIDMDCMDKTSYPALFVGDVTEWSIPDPKGKPIGEVRQIRDLTEKRTRLCKTLQ